MCRLLHGPRFDGASASGRAYFEALHKVAVSARERQNFAGARDIGESLEQLCAVYTQLHEQEVTALRAFYVDLLVPLEANVEKDSKQLQVEHKNFVSGHKQRRDAYAKAAAAVKKNSKKGRARSSGVDKQIKLYQTLEESKAKLDAYLSQGFQEATLQERRRLGFVLERHCSLGRHHEAIHTKGAALMTQALQQWSQVAEARDMLPGTGPPYSVQEEIREEPEPIYSTPSLELCELNNRVRRTHSVDLLGSDGSSCLQPPLSRAASDANIDCNRTYDDMNSVSSSSSVDRRLTVKTLHNYSASADTQLSFQAGDTILIIGERSEGWQYGEHTTTRSRGWFPVAYTEPLHPDPGTGPNLGRDASRLTLQGGTVSSWCSGVTSDTGSSDTITSVGTVRAAKDASVDALASHPRHPSTAQKRPDVPPLLLHSEPRHVTSTNFNPLCPDNSKTPGNFRDLYNPDFIIKTDYSSTRQCKQDFRTEHKSKSKTTKTSDDGDEGSDTSLSLSCSLPGLGSSSSGSETQRGRVSFYSSNDSGFSNDGSRPTQPTADYSESDYFRNRALDSSFESSDSAGLVTHFPSHSQVRSCSLGRCEDLLFHKRENSHCRDSSCLCNNDKTKDNSKLSPSARRILAQRSNRANEKRGKGSLKRSKSLLCLGMNSCRGVPDDLLSNDYEEMFMTDWYHRSLVDVNRGAIPEPPTHSPPSPPCRECMTNSCSTSCTYCVSDDPMNGSSKSFNNRERSMSDKVARKPCKLKKRPPMPLPIEASESGRTTPNDFLSLPPQSTVVGVDRQVSKKSSSPERKRHSNGLSKSLSRLSRSLTWASPKSQQQNNKQTYMYESNRTAHHNLLNGFKSTKQVDTDNNHKVVLPGLNLDYPKTPPLPPRSKKPNLRPVDTSGNEPVNMLTYSEFIARRLCHPSVPSVVDERASSGEHICGKWFDLWDDRTTCTEI
ncbi:SH3 domain [Trinorchestia longiramus]|nr:SH3 domain [Trinorchestia longiramus]